MTTRPRTFLLDENMPRRVLSALRTGGYAATRVRDEGLGSQPDTAIFVYARAHQMTIVTFDTDYLDQTVFPPPHAGILVVRFFPRNTSVAELASAVLNAVGRLAPFDISNRVFELTPARVDER